MQHQQESQLDWISRRRLGMTRVQNATHKELGDSWTDKAAVYLKHFANAIAKGQPFMLEDARLGVKQTTLPQPANMKAWGPAARRAASLGWIVSAGYGPARSSNGSPKVMWKAA